ncbi:MAG TPA: hypothetical protein VM580_28695 [Labilithrix sp.]|nr:hypothetical protein [Labilithrix sp.]
MADETHEAHLASQAHGRGKASGRTPTVFVTDGSADGARIADALRMAGYLVVDVPLAMLVTRAQAERPNVVLVDADAASALEEAGRLRRVPGAGAIDFVYFGSGAGPIKSVEDAMSNEGSAFFPRPVDAGALLRRLEALTGGPVPRAEVKRTPPPSPSREALSDRPSSPSLPSPGLRTPGPPLPMSVSSLADLVDPPFPIATFATVSNELQQLLAEAELRAGAIPDPDVLPTPEEEIEAVLPADVLASLDEPIEGDEDEEHDSRGGTGPGHDREGGTGRPTTVGGTKQTTASTRSAPPTQTHAHTNERRVGSESLSRELTPSRTLQLEPQRQTRRDVRISSAPPVPAAAPAVPAPASVELRPPTRPSFDRSPRAATVAQARRRRRRRRPTIGTMA